MCTDGRSARQSYPESGISVRLPVTVAIGTGSGMRGASGLGCEVMLIWES